MGPAPGARLRARERATSCSGDGAVLPIPTLIINDLAASSTHHQPLLPTGSVTTIVTVICGSRAGLRA
jgi:hypothetical protein